MLLRIDDNVEIDMSYITCAEYQLFIDEKREAGKNCQPDHWTTDIFPRGYAKKPITGVRASNAEEFCEWLTQRDFVPGFKYRLPTLAEAKEYPATEKQIGCWCNDGGKKAIAGIQAIQWQAWRNDLDDILNRDLKAVDALVHALALDQDRILPLGREFESHGVFGIADALNRAGVCKIAAKLTNQLIINSRYFQSFNLASTLAEDNICDLNFINDTNCSGDKIIGIAETFAGNKIFQNHSEIEDISKKIRNDELDLYSTREKAKACRKKHDKILDELKAKVRQIEVEYNNLTSSVESCEIQLIKAHNYIEQLEKYKQIAALEDTENFKIKLLETIKNKLDEARNHVRKIDNYEQIRELDQAYTEILNKQLSEARNQVIKIEQDWRQIEAMSDTEPSQKKLGEILNRQLSEARNQVRKLERNRRQIKDIADIATLGRKLTEAQNQIRKHEHTRNQEVTSLEKLEGIHKNAITNADKRKVELMGNCERYEKVRSAFADALRLATNRSYWLFIIYLWDLLSRKDKKDDAWNFYEFLVLRDARRVGQIPAWEGIRVVRERMQE